MTTRLRWLDVPGDALAPRPFLARRPAGDVPGVLWSPVARAGGPSPGEPPPVVLLGHGGSGHKTTDRLCRLAGLLRRAGVAALAIDGPFHGDRAGPGDAGPGYQRRVIALGADPVMDSMVADWLDVLDLVAATGAVAGDRVGVFGSSMGSRYGIPVAAALGDRLRCAVFGTLGLEQSELIDRRVHNAERIAAAARRITAPLLQHVQWDDEIYQRRGQFDLFGEFAAADKQLRARTGPHAGAGLDDEEAWAAFLIQHLAPTTTETR